MSTESVSENKTGPKDILNAISADRWKEIAKELEADKRYKNFNTLGNLSVLLEKAGIGGEAEDLADELLRGDYNLTTDLTFALCTNQGGWFKELILQKESQNIQE